MTSLTTLAPGFNLGNSKIHRIHQKQYTNQEGEYLRLRRGKYNPLGTSLMVSPISANQLLGSAGFMPVATSVSLTEFLISSLGVDMPKNIVQSGCTSLAMRLAASLTSPSVRSGPPLT